MIELLDELAGSVREAAWPSIRGELGLSYLQIGLLLSVPAILSGIGEPVLGIISDIRIVEVVGVSTTDAAFAVTLWTGSEVAGDLLLIPLIERLDGMRYLRWSAAALVVLFPCFLLAGPLGAKLIIMTVMGLLRAGWYAILQARLYECLPGRSGAALALGNIAGLAGALIPLGLGALAQSTGLPAAMWALLAGPLALLVGLPRKKR